MASTVPAPSRRAPQRAGVLVLAVDVRSRTERELVEEWRAEHHPDAAVLDAGDPALADGLERAGDVEVLPVRVTWTSPPSERADGEETPGGTTPRDALALLNPIRPPAPVQPILRRLGDDRVQVTAGASASVADLRERCERETGRTDAEALSTFVARQAILACDRAERQVLGNRYKVPRLVAEQIAASSRFRDRVASLAGELEQRPEEVQSEAEGCLNELATVQSALGGGAYRRFVRPMHANAWTVEVERSGLARLQELNRSHALVFLPTHRSYVDTFVLHDALEEVDLPRNHVMGGDNMSFWPLGPLGKRAGVVWIRRKFGSDKIYKLAVREFLGHLVAKRFNLEWYIEGGRTRTGKLRPPRIGMLRYLTEALEDDREDDVALVPVAIVYDRLQEVTEMTAEQGGKAKKSEGLGWWVNYVRSQRENVGKARVHVGEPFLLREALEAAGDAGTRLEKVAFRICDGINAVTPVTPTSLVTFALLGSRDVALDVDQVARMADPLLEYAAARGLPGPIEELRTRRGLKAGLAQLTEAGVLACYDKGTEPVWSIAPGGHHIAAFYRNGVIHHFVNRAIVEVALLDALSGPRDGDLMEAAWDVALRLRDLLKFEFFFADKSRFREQLTEELDLLAPDWREQAEGDPAQARERLLAARPLVAHRTLRCFLDAQLIAAERLVAHSPRESIDRKAFVQSCMDVGRQDLLQGRVEGPESISRESFSAALDLAANRDLVDPGRDELVAARQAFLDEVRAAVADLDAFRAADQSALQEVLRDHAG